MIIKAQEFLNDRSIKWLNFASFFALVFLLFYFQINVDGIFFDIYIERDLQRALGWLKGEFYWPGPETSYGSNLPGPFFYFLLIPPLLFGDNIYNQILIWYITWFSLTYTTAFYFADRICKHKASLLIFLMFLIVCTRGSLFIPIVFGWNASFAIMFHVLALIALYYWKETNKNSYLYFLGLIIGFGIQVHFLVSAHLLTVFLLYLFERKKRWKPIVLFITLILLPCLPYFSMYSFKVFETSIYSGEILMNYVIKAIFSEKWFWNINEITDFKIYLIGPFLFVCFLTARQMIKKSFPITTTTINLLIIITPPILVSVLVGRFIWYLYFINIFSILFFSKLCDDLMPKNQKKCLNYLLIYGGLFIFPLFLFLKPDQTFYSQILWPTQKYFVIILLLTPMIIFLSGIKKGFVNNLWKICILLFILNALLKPSPRLQLPTMFSYIQWFSYNAMEPLFKQILLETNWDNKTTIKRIFSIGGANEEISLLSYYSLAKEKFGKDIKNYTSSKADGYFIIQNPEGFLFHTRKDWKQYLSLSVDIIPEEIRKEIQTDKLIIKTPKLYKKLWLIPYKVTENSVFPDGFHNIGQHYYWEEPEWLKNCPSTHHFRNNNDFYYCMILPGHLQRAGVHIKLSKNTSSFMDISVFGPLLGLKDEPSSIDGYAFWSNIEISLFCNNKKYLYFIPDIGYNPRWYGDVIAQIKSLNTPLKLKVPVDCKKEKISQIKLSFEHFRRKYPDYSKITPDKKEIIWKIL